MDVQRIISGGLQEAFGRVVKGQEAVDVAQLSLTAAWTEAVVDALLGQEALPAGIALSLRLPAEIELAFVFECLQGGDEFLPEHRGEGGDGKQEVLRGAHEGAAIILEHTAGDDAAHVGMVIHRLAPGMQDHDDSELAVPAVPGKGLQGLGGNAKQQAVEDLRVLARQGQQDVREGKDEVEVLDRQQLQLAGIDPGTALAAAALGAVAVAAGVVADLDVAAVLALIDMSAQGRGAALLDGCGSFRTTRSDRETKA
jgi:hypothetical protein